MDLLKQKWFYASPSPLTLFFWFLLAIYGTHILLKKEAKFKRSPKIFAFVNALFLVGLVILIQDTCWLVLDALRWVPVYPQFATLDFWLCFPRNILGILLMFMATSRLYGFYRLNIRTFMVLVLYCIVTVVLLWTAPHLGYTNYTYAIEQNMSDATILTGFMLNYFVGKPIIAWMYATIWQGESA